MSKQYNKENSAKMERLYLKYRMVMLAEAYNILYDNSEAEDAVQQAFMKLTRCIDRIQEDNPGMTCNFLKVVTRNVAKDIYKKRIYLNADEDTIERTTDNKLYHLTETSQVVINKDSFDKVMKAIMSLPDIYRDVLLIEKVYGYPREESMKILNANYETLKKRLTRAKSKLLDALREEGIEDGPEDYRRVVR